MQIAERKEWLTKEEILQLYPIGATTYKKKIKTLENSDLSGYTRMIVKPLLNCNLKHIQVREIHRSILNELFGSVRAPNHKKLSNIIKWVNNTNWDWFGNIIPCNSYPVELKGKMNYLFKKLKKRSINCKPTLFYSIEKNTKDDYFHSHFLIRDELSILSKEELLEYLELIAEKNTSKETRIYLEPYDYKNHGVNGSNYTLKDIQYGYEILK